ncbi:MAG: 16S rRNA (uracil(1498)-N(3))-methyltransferase [Lachnospiraceae bacterium]|nr:16S rRNA (uracil(1498)-N(3))-methyltransferase [Lachnospiraceae bacterium]
MIHIFTDNFTDTQVVISGDDYNHLSHALRIQPGDDILVSDGNGRDVIAAVAEITDREIIADIIRENASEAELRCRIVLYQALPKSDKMDFIIQKCVELGVAEIVPVETARCIVKLDAKARDKKVERWQKIASSAAEQSQRSRITKICPVMRFKDAIKDACKLSRCVMPYEHKDGRSELKSLLEDARESKSDSIGIFIGPEGGFDEKEVEIAASNGIEPISLGHRILRTETAGMALIAALMLEEESGL